MKQRNIVVCILLSIVTCGLYSIYWLITLNDTANTLSGRQGTSGGMVFLFSILTCGIYLLYWCYQMGVIADTLRSQNGKQTINAPIIYLILSIFGLQIVTYCLLQDELNNYLPNA